MINELLSPIKTARMLGVKPQTLAIWRCAKRYNLPFVRIGRKVFYQQNDVDAFIKSNRQVNTQKDSENE